MASWMKIEFGILYFFQSLHTPWLDKVMVGITSLGDHGQFWLLLALVLLCIKKTRKMGISMCLSMMLGFLLGNVLLKNLFERPRPCWIDPSVQLLISNPQDFSFPSGHSLVSWEGAVSIFLRNRRWGIPAVLLAALIACSRLYLFVHFPTDVLVGSLMGAGIAWVVYRIVNEASGRRERGS